MFRNYPLLSAFFAVLVLFFSCGRPQPLADKKVFRYNEAAGIASLDPAFAKDQAMIWADLQLYNGLVQTEI